MRYQPTVSIVTTPECSSLAKSVHAIMHVAGHDVRSDVIMVDTKVFADGNALPKITKTVRRTEVYLFYAMPLGEPEKGIARLAQILNAIHLGDPVLIKVVMPYFEGRQDRKDGARTPITAKVMARVIEGEETVRGFVTFDLHADQLVLAFDHAVENLWGQKLLAHHARLSFGSEQRVGVVAPDVGSSKRAEKFADKSGFTLLGVIEKKRKSANSVSSMRYIGDPVAGYHIILPDDLIDTGGTMVLANKTILAGGALSCSSYVTHWLASPKGDSNDPLYSAEAKFRDAGLKVVTTNTIPRTQEYWRENGDIVSFVQCEGMLADAIIRSITPEESVSALSE